VSDASPTAARAGLAACRTCGLLSRAANEHGKCPRCGALLAVRVPASMQRTWAFMIAAAICYVPANLLPVLETTTAKGVDTDTIMQGVVLLWSPTGWPLALIVLVASIMIPTAKIVALGYLLLSVQRRSHEHHRQRLRVYRIVEAVGRWSMVDVFVGTFTAALVQLQPLMSVSPGPGIFFFASVVVMTMLAAESFDPRLIWDTAKAGELNHG